MAEVVNGVAHLLVRHDRTVLLTEQDRDESGLPVMAMNDIGALISVDHEFDGSLGEESESFGIVCVSVQAFPAEEVCCRMWLYEETLPPARVAEPYRAEDSAVVPGHPQIVVAGCQAPDIGVTQAGVLRQDDLDRVSSYLEFAAQTRYHIPEPARLSRWRAFGRHHDDIHA